MMTGGRWGRLLLLLLPHLTASDDKTSAELAFVAAEVRGSTA